MTTTSKYNRSEIMKEAWNLYRSGYGTFSNCLKAAWRGAKFEMKQAMMVAKREAERMRMYEECAKRAALMTDAEKQTLHEKHMLSFNRRGMYTGV